MITLLNKFDDNYVLEKKDIYDIASTYIKENKIESCLKDIVFTNDKSVRAIYNISKNVITINDKKIIESCYRLFDGIQKIYKIDEEYYCYFLNFYYLYIIYHELMHVNQKAKYEKKDNELFNYLYELCLILLHNNRTFYKRNHDIFPMEIEANNFGFLTAYNLMNYTKLPMKETRVMHLQYLFSLLLNYEKNNNQIKSPIELLREGNNIVDINLINVLLDKQKLSKLERMNLGLPINLKEYDSIDYEKYKSLVKAI